VIAVVKIGTSSITDEHGEIANDAMAKLCTEVAAARGAGHEVIVVTSGAVAAGLPTLGLTRRPSQLGILQAVAAVGQPRLMERYFALFAAHSLVPAQVLLTPYDFIHRTQYLHARETMRRLLDLGCVPVVNENDTVADDEIRYGDNDRLAALVAHLVNADLLLLLTDMAGLYTADPRVQQEATLIEEIVEVDEALEAMAGGTGTARGSGGMGSKLAAAKIAAWSGVRAVIAGASDDDVVARALNGEPVGTVVQPRPRRLPSRKLWIAFAQGALGRLQVDDGARRALVEGNRSLLPAGVRSVDGAFDADDPVEVVGEDGRPFAKGLVRYSATRLRAVAGRKTGDLGEGDPHEVIHRDDLVVLPR
jgi:glutamate 5-kinase